MSDTPNIGARIELQGEKEYRDALREINSSHRVLNSELKASAAEFIGNANSMEALAAKNDILIKKQNEQKKAVELLRGALQNAANEYGENSKQTKEYEIKLNNAYANLKKLDKELEDNQKYLKEAENSTDKTSKSIDEYGKKVKVAKEETSVFGDVLKASLTSEAIVAGVKAVASAIKDTASNVVNLVKSTAAYADDIMTMSTNTGIATDTLQELNYMAELTDTSLDTITSTMVKNIRAMNNAKNGSSTYIEAYRELGIAVTDANGQLRNSEDVFWSAIDALGKMSNETERNAIAMQIFGRSAQDLNSLISVGSKGVAEFAEEAREVGAVLSSSTLVALGETDDALQRMYQQMDIVKRDLGVELAPAITEALGSVSKKIVEVDDEFGDFAKGALGNVVDSFIWMIDNADTLEAGLKGITAAIVTKKAADGITYAITAYRTLTTATEAATVAQTAYNSVSKASVIGAIASVVVGLGTALYSYAKANSDAAEEAAKLNDELDKQIEKSDKLRDTISSETDARKSNKDEMVGENQAAKTLIDSLYDLAETENKTNETKQQMAALIDKINEQMPELSLGMDEYTGILNKQRGEVEKLVEANLKLQMVEAAKDDLSTIATNKYESEKNLNTYLEARLEYEKQIEEVRERYNNALDSAKYSELGWNFDTLKYGNELTKLTEKWQDNEDKITSTTQAITDLGKEYQTALGYIGDNSQLSQATSSLDNFSSKLRKALQDQDTSHIKSVSERNKAINKEYAALTKAQEKILKEEAKAFNKAQTEKVELVKKASEKEIKTLELAHKEKLKLIDAEYLEKLKNTDEDKYKELKAVQDKIDDFDKLSEAEDRALKNKEDAEKKAELQARVNNAKTVEEKLEAQKELKDFEDTLARERLRTERELQKDILEEQKTAIEEAYDAKIATLEEEKTKEEEKAKESFEKNKEIAQNKLSTELAILEEIQTKEKESFTERQTELKDHLKEQKDLAIENAKTIYEEELKEYKINLASKYDAAVENEKMIYGVAKQYNQDKAKINLPAVTDTLKNTPVWSSDRAFGNQSAGHILNKALANSPAQYSSSEIEDALIASIKQLNLKVVLNEKELGRVLDNHLRNTLR